MRKYSFSLLLVGLILVFLNPVHSQPGKKISLGVNASVFSEKSSGLNLGFSATGLFNVNKFISLYASSGFLHRTGAGIRSTVSVIVDNNPVEKVTTGKIHFLNYIPALVGVRLYANSEKTKPYLEFEYGQYFSSNSHIHESTLVNHRSFRSISIGGGFTREISSNKRLDASLVFSENNLIANSFRVNVGMLWDF